LWGLTGLPHRPTREEMFQDASDLAAMAEVLGRSSDYRVLRRLVPRPTSMLASSQETKIGILLDTEITGLDHRKDEVIELGMVKFGYTRPTGASLMLGTPSPASMSRPSRSQPRSRRSPASATTWWPATRSTRQP
jgi:DNA polymerase III epsilon subunit-like protein